MSSPVRRYCCLFSSLFNNVSRDAILALQSDIKGLLAASFVVVEVLVMVLQALSNAAAPLISCLHLLAHLGRKQ